MGDVRSKKEVRCGAPYCISNVSKRRKRRGTGGVHYGFLVTDSWWVWGQPLGGHWVDGPGEDRYIFPTPPVRSIWAGWVEGGTSKRCEETFVGIQAA